MGGQLILRSSARDRSTRPSRATGPDRTGVGRAPGARGTSRALKRHLVLADSAGPDAHAPVNLGTPEEITIRELAQRVIRLVGSASILQEGPAEAGDPGRRCPDITRARKFLGFNPVVTLDEGLKLTIEAMRRAP